MRSFLENKLIVIEIFPSSQKKTFKPLILFHDDASSPATLDESPPARIRRQSLIEEHRIKTKDMLDYNALLWENEGRPYCSTSKPSSSDQSPSPSHITNRQLTPRASSNRSSISFSYMPSSNELIFNNQRQANNPFFSTSHPNSVVDILEPRTQTSTPLPLYNASHDKLMERPAEVTVTLHYHQDNHNTMLNSEPERDEVDSPINTTTFIAEPQFHHTYRPNISRKRRRGNLPKEVTEFLKRWLILHKKHPYPTESEKQKLADETGLMVSQISNWFINARRRILQPLLESESQQMISNEDEIDSIPSGSNDSDLAYSSRSRRNSGAHHEHVPIDQSSDGSESLNRECHQGYYNSRSIQPQAEDHRTFQASQPPFDHAEGKDPETTSSVPPPWVLLPAKLPSMNILEKDLDALKPE